VLRPIPAAETLRRHQDLDALTAAVQAKRLTSAFCGVAPTVSLKTTSVGLEECLTGVDVSRRRAVIKAYWNAAARAAEYRVLAQQAELLVDLVTPVTHSTGDTTRDMARLRAAQMAVEAALIEAEVRVLAAQSELTERSGRSLAEPWLAPKTLPHAGTYQLEVESLPRSLADQWTLRRLATTIPSLNGSLRQCAEAVVAIDARRAQTVQAYRQQQVGFDRVLDVVQAQTEETLAFLEVLDAYNQSIADYALAVVPATLPESQLVSTLVVVR